MAQRNSGYERVSGDLYVTPQWVWDALYSVEPWAREADDPAPINADFDYLTMPCYQVSVATNPPFSLAEQFTRKALREVERGVAMLLPMAWDAAKTRRDLFENHPFKAKYTLTKRIRWENLEQKKAGPSNNHAWFVWDWSYQGKPFLGYLPKLEAA